VQCDIVGLEREARGHQIVQHLLDFRVFAHVLGLLSEALLLAPLPRGAFLDRFELRLLGRLVQIGRGHGSEFSTEQNASLAAMAMQQVDAKLLMMM
jgi:hypothetical protein